MPTLSPIRSERRSLLSRLSPSNVVAYALASVAILTVAPLAHASVITRDVNVTVDANSAPPPGDPTAIDSYDLDLDSNGVIDFTFDATAVYSGGVPFTVLDQVSAPSSTPNGVLVTGGLGTGSPPVDLLMTGDTVPTDGLFTSGSTTANLYSYIFGFGDSGNFLGQTGFVGLRFDAADGLHYGFAQVTVNALDAADGPFDLTVGTVGYNDVALEAVQIPSPVPEPMALSLFGAGLLGAAAMRRKRTSR